MPKDAGDPTPAPASTTAEHDDFPIDPAFVEQCLRSMRRPLADRLKYGFVQPIHREKVNRSFRTMSDYREFCRQHYPEYLGYGPAQESV